MAYEPFVGYGTRKGVVYELDSTYGLINPPDTTPYTGIEIYGIRGLNLAQTNVRRISHFDGDKIGLVQIFPTLDVPSGTITVDGADLNLQSILGNVKKSTISGIELAPMMTDQQGSEPAIGLLVYQAAKKNTGVQGWHVQFMPSTQAVPQPGTFGDNNYETVYQLAPSSSLKHLWGYGFTALTDGALTAGLVDGFAPYKPRVTAFRADNVEDEFVFDTDLQPTDALYKVYQAVLGVVSEVTVGITKTTSSITFAYPPDEDVIILVPHMVA